MKWSKIEIPEPYIDVSVYPKTWTVAMTIVQRPIIFQKYRNNILSMCDRFGLSAMGRIN